MERNQQRNGRALISAHRYGPTLKNHWPDCIPGCPVRVDKRTMPGCFLFGFGTEIYSLALDPLHTLLWERPRYGVTAACWWQGGALGEATLRTQKEAQ